MTLFSGHGDRLTWRLPLAGLVAFSHLQFSQIRGRQPYPVVRNIPYVISLRDLPPVRQGLCSLSGCRLHKNSCLDSGDRLDFVANSRIRGLEK
jgi:hypothetical protein